MYCNIISALMYNKIIVHSPNVSVVVMMTNCVCCFQRPLAMPLVGMKFEQMPSYHGNTNIYIYMVVAD